MGFSHPERMEDRENPPHASAITEAMRSIGYSPATALADLVDNCITAGATKIQILVSPPSVGGEGGYVSVEDNGRGMTEEALIRAMKWGGEGPSRSRERSDLGRFGLGMKTASFSLGRSLTVATRSAKKGELLVLCWDLDHVAKNGWHMINGPHPSAASLLQKSELARDRTKVGTVVLVSQLDRLNVRATLEANTRKNEATLTKKVAKHLGMVFHRFVQDGVEIRLGASSIQAWDPFQGAVLKDSETLGDRVAVASFILPHHSKLTDAEFVNLGGPLGWSAHQGFLVYRERRLIVPGGWLKMFSPEDNCRLARIRVDLPNTLDVGWGLDVMKSSVTPPSWQIADLQRIGEATRRHAMAVYGFRGARQAPMTSETETDAPYAFWNQIPLKDAVTFRVNRAHPIVQTLKQNVRDPKIAEEFVRAIERLLPLEAILQDPKRTTNGALHEPSADELTGIINLAKNAVKTLRQQGHATEAAHKLVLACEPFVYHAEKIRNRL